MKRIILFCTAFIASALTSYAQTTLSIGLRGGLNFANFAGDNVNTDARTGINFGAFGTYSVKETFGITAEINYAQKGARTSNSKLNVNYLEIPVLFSFFFGQGNLRPKLMAGPYIGLLMNSDIEINNTKFKSADLYNDTDFGAAVGGGLHYRVGDGQWLYLDARYGLGLSDVTKASGNVYNRVFSINIGFSVGMN